MKEWMSLEDPLAFKALAHPTRVTILNVLTQKQASVNDLAHELNMVHAKVHYHVMALLKSELIEQVDSAIKNGIVEKFYRTVAKTFFIGHSIGENTELTNTALSAVENNVLQHRRNELLDMSLMELAKVIIKDSLFIGKNAKVLIEGNESHQELLKALALECRKTGAEALMRYITFEQYYNEVQNVEIDILEKEPAFSSMLYKNVDYWITIGTLTGRSLFAQADKRKLNAWKTGMIKAINKSHKGLRSIVIDFPNKQWANELGLNYAQVYDSFWQALNSPLSELNSLGTSLIHTLKAQKKIKLKGANNSFIEFELSAKRDILLNNGQLTSSLKEDFDTNLFLPGGKISFAPLESSINGQVVVAKYLFRGTVITNINITIKNGKITEFKANDNVADLISDLQHKCGFCAGSLSIGFNPNVTGDGYFNSIKPNSVTLGLGCNTYLGGNIKDKIPVFLDIGEMK